MLESDGTWQEKLAPVLDLIKRNPDAIVDDTSVEKLLSWLAEALNDESQRELLLCRNQSVLIFLSNPPEILLSHPSCANFSLRLAGLIAGSDENVCEALIKNGCLENLFGNFNKLFLTNAVAKCAFFEGLSSVVESFTGLRWAADIQGLFDYAINAFQDTSFYVTKSAILFLHEFLLASHHGKGNQTLDRAKAEIIEKLANANQKCDSKDKHHFLDFVYQMFNKSLSLSWLLLTTFGGLASFLDDEKCFNPRLFHSISDVCHQIAQNGRALSDSQLQEHNLEINKSCFHIYDEILAISCRMAKVDFMHLFRHLSSIICENDSSLQMNAEKSWNNAVIHLTLWSVLRLTKTTEPASTFLAKKCQLELGYPSPDELIPRLKDLESIIGERMRDKIVWRKCLSAISDNCKRFFSKKQHAVLDAQGKYIVECWTLFLCEMLEAVCSEEEKPDDNEFNSVLIGHQYLTSKCIATMKEIVQNGWFQDFSEIAKLQIILSMLYALHNASLDVQALCLSIELFGSLVETLDAGFINALFSWDSNLFSEFLAEHFEISPDPSTVKRFESFSKTLPNSLRKLLMDTRWEVKDSTLDLISTLIRKSIETRILEDFFARESFWLESWKLLDTDESYVRASAVRLVGLIQERPRIRDVLHASIPLDDVLLKLLSVFENDDEAFPKRSVMEVIYRWIDLEENRKEVLKTDLNTDCSENQSIQRKVWTLIFRIMRKAWMNFDWEVKLKGILCWAKILRNGAKGEEIDSDDVRNQCLELAFANGGTSILVKSINDCDQLVRDASLKTIKSIHDHFNTKARDEKDLPITSCHDIEGELRFDSVDHFLRFVDTIDFEQLDESVKLADDRVVNNPLSLLNDIIAAAKHDCDNLLDCY